MAGPGGEGDLRRLLKLHRTEIAMAVDDIFPLLHGLADHDVVPEHIFKETLSRTEREGSHRAFHALLTWLLGQDAAAVRDFWEVLFKDYNLERYTRLRPLRGAFPREVELGRQHRGRRLSPSPIAPHRPQGKRRAPEERDGARAVQPSPRHTASPGPLVKVRTVKKPEGVDAPRAPRGGALQAAATSVQRAVAVASSEVPVTQGAIEGILTNHTLEPGVALVRCEQLIKLGQLPKAKAGLLDQKYLKNLLESLLLQSLKFSSLGISWNLLESLGISWNLLESLGISSKRIQEKEEEQKEMGERREENRRNKENRRKQQKERMGEREGMGGRGREEEKEKRSWRRGEREEEKEDKRIRGSKQNIRE
ncbi:hypothetical protein AAES_144827 [Amazona aestiva]|uniref:HSR domain-containing protein n=1 Tax=Amazona aestiva TaxID=12930 RepID=A0A0Q3QQX3_AMAAE|nr:hypothetical protein AAES_144827 [Amazona aestiva]